jgi:hypothetical protein
MTEELDKLFPIKPQTVTIQGVDYPVKKITVSIMASVNILTDKAFAVIDLENIENEVDVAAITASAISALIDDGEVQRRMETVISALTGMKPEKFKELTTEDLVDLIVTVVKVNKDFFAMRLAPKMRLALAAGQK